MNDSSTSLAENPAGKASISSSTAERGPGPLIGPGRGRLRRSVGRGGGIQARRAVRWQSLLLDSPPTSVLLDEASRLIAIGQLKGAMRVLAVAATTAADEQDRRTVLRRLAVTSADGGHHRISCEAVYELQQIEPRDADTWVTFANVALARGNYEHADSAARAALEIDSSHHGAWIALSAGYAGLGWFDDAEDCLDQLDRQAITDRERWRIGRAVNRWAMAKSRWPTIGAVALVVVGVLALAIAASVPFVAREFRLRSLRTDRATGWFESAATDAWRFERRLRLGHGAVVVTSVLAFLAAVFWL